MIGNSNKVCIVDEEEECTECAKCGEDTAGAYLFTCPECGEITCWGCSASEEFCPMCGYGLDTMGQDYE
jgi:hypothetical protein